MARIIFEIGRLLGEHVIGALEFFRVIGDFRRSGMAGLVNETSEWHLVRRAATLMIEAQRVITGKSADDPFIDAEGIRRAQVRNKQPVFSGGGECAEIGFQHVLVTGRGKPGVATGRARLAVA